MPRLPPFIPPMLAGTSDPFDAPDHLFEIKWDGFRAMLYIDAEGTGGQRLIGRRRSSYATKFPDLVFPHLPPGTAIDGEIVILVNGKPDFTSVLRSSSRNATFVAFDLVYENFTSITHLPLETRRARLKALLTPHLSPRLAFSEGTIGTGKAFFEHARALGLEGMIAKRLGSPYEPGQRSGAWLKIKAVQEAVVAIVGYEQNDDGKLRSLVIAAEDADGHLLCAGQCGAGISVAENARLLSLLSADARTTPYMTCTMKGRRYRWVNPGHFCRITYLERLPAGAFRAPIYRGLYDKPTARKGKPRIAPKGRRPVATGEAKPRQRPAQPVDQVMTLLPRRGRGT